MKIETRTTGFSSPASDYAADRIYLCDEKPKDPYFTYYFRSDCDMPKLGCKKDEILEVSRRVDPSPGDFCIGVTDSKFIVYRHGIFVPDSHWGVITGIIPQL